MLRVLCSTGCLCHRVPTHGIADIMFWLLMGVSQTPRDIATMKPLTRVLQMGCQILTHRRWTKCRRNLFYLYLYISAVDLMIAGLSGLHRLLNELMFK